MRREGDKNEGRVGREGDERGVKGRVGEGLRNVCV